MPMFVTIETTAGDFVEHFRITNIGHPLTSDHPADDDLRNYRVQGPNETFVIPHNRGDGARTLALLALLGPALTSDEIREKYDGWRYSGVPDQQGPTRRECRQR